MQCLIEYCASGATKCASPGWVCEDLRRHRYIAFGRANIIMEPGLGVVDQWLLRPSLWAPSLLGLPMGQSRAIGRSPQRKTISWSNRQDRPAERGTMRAIVLPTLLSFMSDDVLKVIIPLIDRLSNRYQLIITPSKRYLGIISRYHINFSLLVPSIGMLIDTYVISIEQVLCLDEIRLERVQSHKSLNKEHQQMVRLFNSCCFGLPMSASGTYLLEESNPLLPIISDPCEKTRKQHAIMSHLRRS